MISDRDFDLIKESLNALPLDAFFEQPDGKSVLEERWAEMVHKLLLERHCPCIDGNTAACFLSLQRITQIEALRETDISLENFISIVEDARQVAFAQLARS